MKKCIYDDNPAIECLLKWTNTDGKIIKMYCLFHEKKLHDNFSKRWENES